MKPKQKGSRLFLAHFSLESKISAQNEQKHHSNNTNRPFYLCMQNGRTEIKIPHHSKVLSAFGEKRGAYIERACTLNGIKVHIVYCL